MFLIARSSVEHTLAPLCGLTAQNPCESKRAGLAKRSKYILIAKPEVLLYAQLKCYDSNEEKV